MRKSFNRQTCYFALFAAFCIFLLNACFSPWTGEGTLTIVFGSSGQNGSRQYIEGEEYEDFRHEVYLVTPDGKMSKIGEFKGRTGTLSVSPGTYRVIIKGYGENNQGEIVLRSYGISHNTHSITLGQNESVEVRMTSAVEVTNEDQLITAFYDAGVEERQLFIVVNGKITVNETLNTNGYVLLIAHENAEIVKGGSGSVFYISSGWLSLGVDGMPGELTLTGNNVVEGDSLIYINSRLIMNDGVYLTGNTALNGGGVYVGRGGMFNMEGGVISGNTAHNSGGGVYISEEGIFFKNGGIIYGNDGTFKSNKVSDGTEEQFGHAAFYEKDNWYKDTTSDATEEGYMSVYGDDIKGWDGKREDTQPPLGSIELIINPPSGYERKSIIVHGFVDSSGMRDTIKLTINDSDYQFNSFSCIINGEFPGILFNDELDERNFQVILSVDDHLEDGPNYITILAYDGSVPWSGVIILVVNDGEIEEEIQVEE